MMQTQVVPLLERMLDTASPHQKVLYAEHLRVTLLMGYRLHNHGDVVVKQCGCGRNHTISQWMKLPLIGHQSLPRIGGEMRNCQCGSTMLLTTRKAPTITPRSRLLHHTYMDSNLPVNRPRHPMIRQVNFIHAFHHMKQEVYVDRWEDRQVKEALFEGKSPEWNVGEGGALTPKYYL